MMTTTTGNTAILRRFLLTGCGSGVYRAGSGGMLKIENNQEFLAALAQAGPAIVSEILHSQGGDAALFALAAAASPRFASKETNARALAALPVAAAKARDLEVFARYAGEMRGWGRGLRNAVTGWYAAQPVESLVSQILRRPGRHLREHRAILRRSHPKAESLAQNALYQWISDGALGHLATAGIREGAMRKAQGYELAKRAASVGEVRRIVEDYKLKPSMVPSRWASSPEVWEALFDQLSHRQILRHLGAMTRCGLITRGSAYAALTVARIADRRRIAASGVHPLRVASAMKRYRTAGNAVESIFDALEEALHLAAACAVPYLHGRRLMVAVDGTGSMQGANVHGMTEVPAALAAATLALTFARTSERAVVTAFGRDVRELEFGGGTRLAEALNQIGSKPSRGEAAAPLRYALANRLRVDAFVILTDRVQRDAGITEAWLAYRNAMGIEARLALVNLSSREIPAWDAGGHPDAMALGGLDHHRSTQSLHAFLSA